MSNWRISSLIIGLGLLVAYVPSHAAFIEPIVGYSLESIDDGDSDNDAHKGVYLGGRLGMGIPIVPMLWVALDGGVTTGGEYKSKPGDVKADANRTLLGASVGVDIPVVPIIDRVWAGYNFIDQLNFEGDTKVTGSSVKLGLGLKFVPFISLNVEYIITNYSKGETGSTKVDIDEDAKTVLVSVSLPLP